MSAFPDTMRRAADVDSMRRDPLGFLAAARSRSGDVVAIRDAGPVFSRDPDCAGVVAVFGAELIRAVLGDSDAFGMPVSAAKRLSLPPELVRLNFGLFSMRGPQHAEHQRLLLSVLNPRSVAEHDTEIAEGLRAFAAAWRPGGEVLLLAEMRELALQVSSRLLFGGGDPDALELARLIQAYFQLRREAASPLAVPEPAARDDLITLGLAVDESLRRRIRSRSERRAGASGGLLARLAAAELRPGRRLSEDELVAHANVLFMSSSEPVAVAMAWMCLLLSQRGDTRDALRGEIGCVSDGPGLPDAAALSRMPLFDAVVKESLRLLPPNALMVRLTTRPVELAGWSLPARCEIVLSPFLAHREAGVFARPNEFDPSRWSGIRPSQFEYLPFGAGERYCMGRHLATHLMKVALCFLVRSCDLVLARDQEIDWRIHINLMPSVDPSMRIEPVGATSPSAPGRALGAFNDLVCP